MGYAVEPKQAVTLRLPRNELEFITDYALAEKMTRTDAFLHFLRLGIASTKSDSPGIDHLAAMIEEVLSRLPEKQINSSEIIDVVSEESSRFPAIKTVILFGSFARGDATSQSDIDLRILFDNNGTFSLYDVARFQKAITKQTGREVDVITAQEINNKNLELAIEKEGVVIYERDAE